MQSFHLSLSKPIINGYLHHAFPLSIMPNHRYFNNWFYSNYIQLFSAKDYSDLACPLNFYLYQDYNNYSLLEIGKINRELVESITDIDRFIVNALNKGYYIITFINDFFIPTRDSYQKKSGTHDILINGYDHFEGTLTASSYINKKFTQFPIKKSNFIDAYTYNNYAFYDYAHEVLLLKPNHTIQYPLNYELIIQLLDDYLSSTNSFRSSFFPTHDKLAFGLDVYKYLINDLVKVQNGSKGGVDIRPLHLVWEHKKVMLARICFFLEKGYINNSEYATDYADIEQSAKYLRLLMFIYSATRSYETITTIVERLHKMQNDEYSILSKLLSELKLTFSHSSGRL